MQITTIGLDLAKYWFQVHGVLRAKFLHLARLRARGKSQQFGGFRRSDRRQGMARRAENGRFDHFRGLSACRFRRNGSPAPLEMAVFADSVYRCRCGTGKLMA